MKKPSERYQDVLEMARDIHSVLLPNLPEDLQDFEQVRPRELTQTSAREKRSDPKIRVLLFSNLVMIIITTIAFFALYGSNDSNTVDANGSAVAQAAQTEMAALNTELPETETTVTDKPVSPTVITVSTEEHDTDMPPTTVEETVTGHPIETTTPEEDTAVPTVEITEEPTDNASPIPTDIPTDTPEDTSTPTETPLPTATATSTETPTETYTPTPTPTQYLSNLVWLPIIAGNDAFGIQDSVEVSLALARRYFGSFIPLRLSNGVNGFRVDIALNSIAPVARYGIAYRVQDENNYLLFRIDIQQHIWQLLKVQNSSEPLVLEGGTLPEGSALNIMAVSGMDSYYRFEFAETYIQREQNEWDKGSVGLWIETIDNVPFPLASLQIGLLGDEAIAADTTAPTLVAPILQMVDLLINEVQNLKATGGDDAMVDCETFIDVYGSLGQYLDYDEIVAIAQEVRDVGALIYNRCLIDNPEGQIDMNADYGDYLDWENGLSEIIRRLEAAD
jgi:hypothetical protein